MTRFEQRSILGAYRYDSGEDGIFRLMVGMRLDYGGYVCWPHSDIHPIDRKRAFIYFVEGNDVIKSNRPLSEDDAEDIYKASFGIKTKDKHGKPMVVVP